MVFKCTNCGHENQLGAIFCRSCGGKLNIEEMRPEVKDDRPRMGIFSLIRNIVMTLLLLAVVGIIIGLFLSKGLKEYPAANEETQKAVKEKVTALLDRIEAGSGESNFVLSPQEASCAYNTCFIEKSAEGASSYLIDSVNFDLDDSKDLVVVLETRLGGKIPARFEIKGKISSIETAEPEKCAMKFDLLEAKMGHIGMPEALRGKILEKFSPILEGKNIEKILNALKSVELDENKNFVLNLKEAPAPVKKGTAKPQAPTPPPAPKKK
ncbi:MAG: hypothetical protein A2X49_16170 [Lentisphaerae bacterium GWF2_52_8]|nr:MAG: hypothetical protein A2X49_16170 [Lentisphaerae bacterium GWF2_52_8]